jgi:hypothetical protein
MLARAFLRISCAVMHPLMGGFAVFCLIYICLYPFLASLLLPYALLWGGLGAAVAYYKDHYLTG